MINTIDSKIVEQYVDWLVIAWEDEPCLADGL